MNGSIGMPGLPVGAGGFGAASSGGFAHPLAIDPNGVQSFGLSVGTALAGKLGGGASVTNYTNPHDLGNFIRGTAPGSGIFDQAMFALNQVCR